MRTGPKYKICRRLGEGVYEQCQTPKFQISKSKKLGGKPRKFSRQKTEYGVQLLEKQKTRFTYGVTDRQLSNYVGRARGGKKAPLGALYQMLERRLDNVVLKLGLAPTRAAARQMVGHGHITVNGKRMSIPSYEVVPGDRVAIREASRAKLISDTAKERMESFHTPSWLERAEDAGGKVVRLPEEPEGEFVADLSRVLEFYSRV